MLKDKKITRLFNKVIAPFQQTSQIVVGLILLKIRLKWTNSEKYSSLAGPWDGEVGAIAPVECLVYPWLAR